MGIYMGRGTLKFKPGGRRLSGGGGQRRGGERGHQVSWCEYQQEKVGWTRPKAEEVRALYPVICMICMFCLVDKHKIAALGGEVSRGKATTTKSYVVSNCSEVIVFSSKTE